MSHHDGFVIQLCASCVGGHGFKSLLSSASDVNTAILVAAVPGLGYHKDLHYHWLAWHQYRVTGWDGTFDLHYHWLAWHQWLGEMVHLICTTTGCLTPVTGWDGTFDLHYHWLAWHQYRVTGWDGTFDLHYHWLAWHQWLCEMVHSICNFCLSVATCEIDVHINPWDTRIIMLACCWDDKTPTNRCRVSIHYMWSCRFQLTEQTSCDVLWVI